MLDALRKYVLPLFDPKTSIAVVASAPGKADEIAAGLKSVGYEVEQRSLALNPDEAADSDSGSESGSDA